MAEWDALAKDMKMLVTIYNERKAGRPIWFSRLAELLKDDLTKTDITEMLQYNDGTEADISRLDDPDNVGDFITCGFFICNKRRISFGLGNPAQYPAGNIRM